MPNPRQNRSAVLAVALAFGAITALCLPFLLTGTDVPAAVLVVGRWTAALASLVAIRVALGGGHLTRLWRLRPATPRELVRSYGLGVAVTVAVVVLPALVAPAIGADLAPSTTLLAAVPLAVLGALVLAVSTLGEEVLWRGHLQTTTARLGFWRSSALVGVVWAAWHLPLHLTYLQQGVLSGVEVLSVTVGLVAWAPLLAALVERRGTVWPAVFAHAVPVSALQLVAPGSAVRPIVFWTVSAASWATMLLAAAVLARRPSRAAADVTDPAAQLPGGAADGRA